MPYINSSFPRGLSDKEIEQHINEYQDAIFKAGASTNQVLQFSPLIQLGQNELQNRKTEKTARLSIGLGLLSVFIASVALVVSFIGSRSSSQWETSQIELLEKIKQEIAAGRSTSEQDNKQFLVALKSLESAITSANENSDAEVSIISSSQKSKGQQCPQKNTAVVSVGDTANNHGQ